MYGIIYQISQVKNIQLFLFVADIMICYNLNKRQKFKNGGALWSGGMK